MYASLRLFLKLYSECHIWNHIRIPLLFVTEYCERYAKKEAIANSTAELESSDEDISDEESGTSDDDIAGHADP